MFKNCQKLSILKFFFPKIPFVRKKSSFDEIVSKPIRQECQKWILNTDQCQQIKQLMLKNIERGLKKSTHDCAIVKCFVTYVQKLPRGDEKAKTLALDLGGTNFRVILLFLNGKNEPIHIKATKYKISNELMIGPGKNLFKYISKCLKKFVDENNLENDMLSLGFTFSFPLIQKGIKIGILDRWTKGFSCPDVIGNDVVALLEKEMKDMKLKTTVTAILNDTTGTLMSCAWTNQDCRTGLIIGTGTNACYAEKIENVETFIGKPITSIILINTEWGAFGEDKCLEHVRNSIDQEMDESTINSGKQIFEKMVSGMYLGELVRRQIEKCVNKKLIFSGKISGDILTQIWKFESKYITAIESENEDCIDECRQILKSVGMCHVTDQDCIDVRYICKVVSTRAAHLVSSGLAALIEKIDEPTCTIGIDGAIYRYHPHFHTLMTTKIAELVKPQYKFKLVLADDGSGIGAGITAALAHTK